MKIEEEMNKRIIEIFISKILFETNKRDEKIIREMK